MAKKKFYAVAKGRTIGVFKTWDEVKESVDSYSGALYKSFTSEDDAMAYIKENSVSIDESPSKKSKKDKVYAVAKGKTVGIFNTWDEVKESVMSYPGALYKSFTSEDDAIAYLKKHKAYKDKPSKKKTNSGEVKLESKKEIKEKEVVVKKEQVKKCSEVKPKKVKKYRVKNIDIKDIFSEDGVFSKKNPFYKKRESQIEATCLLEEALRNKDHFILNGPCGFGKSLTFSTAAMKNMLENGDGKIVIVTSNISLQEQLYYKDIPFVIDALKDLYGEEVKESFRPTLFKGINNFLCLNKYEESFKNNKLTNMTVIKNLNKFMDENESGDLGEADFTIPDDLKRLITTTSDECKGKDCPNKEECYNNRHKDIARGSNIIVTNYHMLFASYLVGSSVFLGTDLIVFDEAHEIEKILREFEASYVSSNAVRYIERRISEIAKLGEGGEITEKLEAFDIDRLKENSHYFFEQLENRCNESKKGPCIVIESQKDLPDPENFKISLLRLAKLLDRLLDCEIGKPSQGEQQSAMKKELDSDDLDIKKRDLKKKIKSLRKTCYKISSMISEVDEMLEDENKVLWFEKENNSIRIGLKDVDVSSKFRNYFLENDELACVLTSATISVDGNFDYIKARLGLDAIENPNKKVYEYLGKSPFNLDTQQLWYVPKTAVPGNKSEFEDGFVAQIGEIIEATNGGVLCLFTSMSNLNRCRRELPKYVEGKTILSQNDAGRRKILNMFKEDVNSVLLATKSFFTGVDVPGESLRCVVIDKLPFESPNDPVQQKLKERPGAFSKYMLPEMIITVQQAVGRGVRSIDDKCVIAILDERIISAGYSRAILGSFDYKKLLTRDVNDLERFLGTDKEEDTEPFFEEIAGTVQNDWDMI